MNKTLATAAIASALGLVACAPEDAHEQGADTAPQVSPIQSLNRDLKLGSQGADVAALHAYLTQYGYFPNASLAESYPGWRPIIAHAPANPQVFDEHTEVAVRALQRNSRMRQTGVVDAEVRELLRAYRCGVPDGITQLDASDKFAIGRGRWSEEHVTWKLNNTDDVSKDQASAAIASSFATWHRETYRWFDEKTSGSADIEITFDKILNKDGTLNGPGDVLAGTSYPDDGGDMTIDTAETWSVAATTPAERFDLQTVVTHELGHALGLDHSYFQDAVMSPYVSKGAQKRELTPDDKVAISAIYDYWEELPGVGSDIGVSARGDTWIVGTNAGIYHFNGNDWDRVSGVATRIAVDPKGVPWVVNDNGDIYRRTTSSATSGSWTKMPGCARDIGIGADGTVWAIGCTVVNSDGNTIHRWNGSSWDLTNGAGIRIAVGDTGHPWVVNGSHNIFRRSYASVANLDWEQLPGLAKDIAIGAGDHTYIIGTDDLPGGGGLYLWDEQEEIVYKSGDDAGKVAAPKVRRWVLTQGSATQVSVGPDGPWLINKNNNIYRPFL